MELLTIEPEHIEKLDEIQLTRLLRLLLYASARTLPVDIRVTTNIKVADGGIDGRWESDELFPPYIPAKKTIYQCKAEKLSPGKCYDEIFPLPSGKGKTRVLSVAAKEALKKDGCYVIFCSYQFNDGLVKSRISKAEKALRDSGRKRIPKDRIRFFDGSQIAAWVNTEAAAIAYVAGICNLPFAQYLKDIEWCLRAPEHSGRYIENDYLKGLKESLRDEFLVEKNVIRVQGLSGLGKTRLVLEALNAEADPNLRPSIPCAYIDISGSGVPGCQINIVESLVRTSTRGLLFADNCSKADHDKLSSIVKREGSRLSLISADFQSDENTYGTKYFQIENTELVEVIPDILKDTEEGRGLSKEAFEQIKRFCDGFPQIAKLMAQLDAIPEMLHLKEKEIAKKLIWAGEEENPQQLKVLRALSLFRHIGKSEKYPEHLDFVSSALLDSITLKEMRELMEPFFRRKIIQNIGDFISVSPRPIAVALSAEWWSFTDKDEILTLLPDLVKSGLMEQFCDRIEDLDFSENAIAITEALYADMSPLSNAEVLTSEMGSRLFRAFSHVNPSATLNSLNAALSEYSIENYSKILKGRRDLLWSLERIVWHSELFDKATWLLFHFAAGENEHYSNNATGMLKQLYHWTLAGTEKPAIERLEIVDEILKVGDPELTKLSIEVLSEGLRRGHFSRSVGSEHSVSKLPKEDWKPRNWGDVFDYWRACFERLEKIALDDNDKMAPLARDQIGRHLRTFLDSPLSNELEPRIIKIAEKWCNYWPVALDVVRSEINHERRQLNGLETKSLKTDKKEIADALEKLERWQSFLSPRNLSHRIELLVSNAPDGDWTEDDDGKYIDNARVRAERLATELYDMGQNWWEYIPMLCRDSQKQAASLGFKLGELSRGVSNGEEVLFINCCIGALKNIPSSERNPDLLGGFLGGFAHSELTQRTLDSVNKDSELVTCLAQLSLLSGVCPRTIERVVNAIHEGRIPDDDLRMFAYGSVTQGLKPEEVEMLIRPLIYDASSSLSSVHQFLHMYCYSDPEKKKALATVFKDLLMCHGSLPDSGRTMDDHYWTSDVSELLQKHDPVFARRIGELLLQDILKNGLYHNSRDNTPSILGKLFRNYSDVVWPLFESEIYRGDKGIRFKLITAIGKSGFFSNQECPLWNLPEEKLNAWVRGNPDLAGMLIHQIALFSEAEDDPDSQNPIPDEDEEIKRKLLRPSEDEKIQWHPLIPKLLETCSDLGQDILSALHTNIFSFGSTGSRVPYLRKRKLLVDQLTKTRNSKLKIIAEDILRSLEREIETEMRRDEEYKHGIF